MAEGYNFEKFSAAILALSNSQIWAEAKPEWELHFVYPDHEDRACECGHQPIHQICVIKNRENTNEAEVGNVCVHNFMRLASKRIFSVLKRIRNDLEKSLNPAALELFLRRKVISLGEHNDYLEYWRKRVNITEQQRSQRKNLNQRVLNYIDTETVRMIENFKNQGLKPKT